jgi:hypothetical protein
VASALWASTEPEDLARLADREGASGLVEAAEADPSRRHTVVMALAYADGFEGLPFLAEVAAGGDAVEARAAVESASALAALPRRAVDPDDAAELRAGCDRLLGVARDPSRPRPVRAGAVRALRMLTDRGCVKAADVPRDVDTK